MTVHHINGAHPDPIQSAIVSIEHYLFRGTSTMACCLVLKDGPPVITLTDGDGMDLAELEMRSRADAEMKLSQQLSQRNPHGNQH